MEEFKMAVCDDEDHYRNTMEELVRRYEIQSGISISLQKYSRMSELVEKIASGEENYDMLFLDVEMADCSGIDGARRIREYDEKVIIVFVTNYDGYALDAFDVEAMGYLMKPVRYEDIEKQIVRGINYIRHRRKAEETDRKYLRVFCQRTELVMEQQEIMYIEKCRNRCALYMSNGEKIVTYSTLQKINGNLNQNKFCFAHQGYIVNVEYVREIKSSTICMENGIEIPISRKYAKTFKQVFLNQLINNP